MRKLIPVIIALSFFSKGFADSLQDMKNIVSSFYSFQKVIDSNMLSKDLDNESLQIVVESLQKNIPVMEQGIQKAKQDGYNDIDNLLSIYVTIAKLQLIQVSIVVDKKNQTTLHEYLTYRKQVMVLINIIKPMY